MRKITVAFVLVGALGCAAPGQTILLVESWGGEGHFAHPKALTVAEEGGVITFDLAALPAGAKVDRARLVCFRDHPAGDADEALVNAEVVLKGRKKPLELIGPWYDAFAVPASAVKGGSKLTFQVKALPGWVKGKTSLEVAYAGDAPAGLPGVRNVRAVHQAGQTFITWKEIEKALEADRPTWRELRTALENLDDKRAVRYRIYHCPQPITPVNFHEASLLAEVKPLSCYNVNGRSPDQAFQIMRKRMLVDMDYAKGVSRRWYSIPASAHDEVAIDRFVVPGPKQPLPVGTGLYVHHPRQAGKGYYAVTVVVNGRENTRDLQTDPGCTFGPVEETVGTGEPVFQREMDMKVLFDYAGRRLQYVQWTAPPLSNLPNQHHNWSVFIPEGIKQPAPLELVLTGNDMFRRPRWPHRPDTVLVSPHDAPFGTFYYGYHESAGTLRSFNQGTIQPYTWRRMLAFLNWAFKGFKIDRARVTCTGDRGASATGALHFGMRHPEVFSLVYTCKGMPNPGALPLQRTRYGRRYQTLTGRLQKLIGRKEWGLKTQDGQNVWEFLDLTREVAAHPEVLRPMLSYGGRGQWDWPPVAEFLKALAAARQPVVSEGTWGAIDPPFIWNPGRRWAGLDVRRDRPVPIFTGCSGDYQGGRNGDGGATNYGLWWEDAGIVDSPEKFEIVLTGGGTVNVTPRRLRKFAIKPGEKLRYQTTPLSVRPGRKAQAASGEAVADQHGLVTIEKLALPRRVKLTVTRSGS